MDQIFLLATNADPRILTDVIFEFARKAVNRQNMQEVAVILWGPAQKTVVSTLELKVAAMDLVENEKIHVWASKEKAEDYLIADKLGDLGIDLVDVEEKVCQLLQAGWHQLTF